MKRILTLTALCALAASPTLAGGWETGKLDTSFLYEDGNYVELSYGSLDYSLNAKIDSDAVHNMAKDQSRLAVSGKIAVGKLEIGLTSFDSGAIQMDGQAAAADINACYVAAGSSAIGDMRTNCSLVPTADINLDTDALVARYKASEQFSVIGGIRRINLAPSTVSTAKTNYTINGSSGSGLIYGFSYEMPQIALKAEVVRSEATKLAASGFASGGLAPATLPLSDSSVSVPESLTLKFQTGIAENTLLMASAHKVKWGSAQIVANVAGTALDVASKFKDTTAYSLGLGRKLNDNTSASLSYSWEDGSGSTSTSPFTMSNGSKTLSVGIKHRFEAVTLSGGVSYTKAGDVTASQNGLSAVYAGNSVTAFGLKVGYNF